MYHFPSIINLSRRACSSISARACRSSASSVDLSSFAEFDSAVNSHVGGVLESFYPFPDGILHSFDSSLFCGNSRRKQWPSLKWLESVSREASLIPAARGSTGWRHELSWHPTATRPATQDADVRVRPVSRIPWSSEPRRRGRAYSRQIQWPKPQG